MISVGGEESATGAFFEFIAGSFQDRPKCFATRGIRAKKDVLPCMSPYFVLMESVKGGLESDDQVVWHHKVGWELRWYTMHQFVVGHSDVAFLDMKEDVSIIYGPNCFQLSSDTLTHVVIQRIWAQWGIIPQLFCKGAPLLNTNRRLRELLKHHTCEGEIASPTLTSVLTNGCPLDMPIGQLCIGSELHVIAEEGIVRRTSIAVHTARGFQGHLECFMHEMIGELKPALGTLTCYPVSQMQIERQLEASSKTEEVDDDMTIGCDGRNAVLHVKLRINGDPNDFCKLHLFPSPNARRVACGTAIEIRLATVWSTCGHEFEVDPPSWADFAQSLRLSLYKVEKVVHKWCHTTQTPLVWDRREAFAGWLSITKRHDMLASDILTLIWQYLRQSDWQPRVLVPSGCGHIATVNVGSVRCVLVPHAPLQQNTHYAVKAQVAKGSKLQSICRTWHFYTGSDDNSAIWANEPWIEKVMVV